MFLWPRDLVIFKLRNSTLLLQNSTVALNGRAVASNAFVPGSKLAHAALFFQVCYFLLGERILILPPKGKE